MSDFIKSLIDEAHVDFLNRQYDECIRKLKSIKMRVKNPEHLGKMQIKENNIDSEYRSRYKNVTSNDDVEFLNKIMALKEWQGKEYIVYYTMALEDYGLE